MHWLRFRAWVLEKGWPPPAPSFREVEFESSRLYKPTYLGRRMRADPSIPARRVLDRLFLSGFCLLCCCPVSCTVFYWHGGVRNADQNLLSTGASKTNAGERSAVKR